MDQFLVAGLIHLMAEKLHLDSAEFSPSIMPPSDLNPNEYWDVCICRWFS